MWKSTLQTLPTSKLRISEKNQFFPQEVYRRKKRRRIIERYGHEKIVKLRTTVNLKCVLTVIQSSQELQDGSVASETFSTVILDIHVIYVLIKILPVNRLEKSQTLYRIQNGCEIPVDQLIKRMTRNVKNESAFGISGNLGLVGSD